MRYIYNIIMTSLFKKTHLLSFVLSCMFLFPYIHLYSQFIIPGQGTEEVNDEEKTAKKATDDVKNIDIVRGLQTKIIGKNQDQVKLTWLPPKKADFLIIARSQEPISTTEKFLDAESVGVIAANITTHIDMNISNGKYYYAIISKKAITEKKIFLYAKDNYTVLPVSIERVESKEKKNEKIAQFIYAKIQEDNSIKLTWKGISVQGINYIVYRSDSIIDSLEDFKEAERLKVINNGAEFFIDRTMPQSGTYYYAVTVRLPGEIENRTLIENSNYTSYGISYEKIDLKIVSSIKATKSKEKTNSVEIVWEDAEDKYGYRYRIYRSLKPILKKEDLAGAVPVVTVEPEVEYYLDENLEEGRYYYAIITINQDNLISNFFEEGKNIQSAPILITKKGQEIERYDFVSFFSKVDGDEVQIAWSLSNESDFSTVKEIQIYRFQKYPSDLKSLPSGEIIARLSLDEVQYKDSLKSSGEYYYAIFLSTEEGLRPKKFIHGINLLGPVTIQINPLHDNQKSNLDNTEKDESEASKKNEALPWEGTIKNRDVKEIEEPYLLYSDKENKLNDNSQKLDNKSSTTHDSNQFTSGIKNQNISIPEYKIQNDDEKKNYTKEEKSNQKKSYSDNQAEKNKNQKMENGNHELSSWDHKQSDKVNKIIRYTYLKNDYHRAVKYLSNYPRIANPAVRSKAIFYLGLSYYNLSEYQKAIQCFVHSDVQKYYGKRANFWYRKTLKQIR